LFLWYWFGNRSILNLFLWYWFGNRSFLLSFGLTLIIFGNWLSFRWCLSLLIIFCTKRDILDLFILLNRFIRFQIYNIIPIILNLKIIFICIKNAYNFIFKVEFIQSKVIRLKQLLKLLRSRLLGFFITKIRMENSYPVTCNFQKCIIRSIHHITVGHFALYTLLNSLNISPIRQRTFNFPTIQTPFQHILNF